MSILEVILLGLALSMDAFAVTVSNLFAKRGISLQRTMLMPVLFGLFQGLMPLIGYFAGSLVADFLSQYAGIITLAILGYIGGKMVWDGFHPEEREPEEANTLTFGTLVLQAIATSIDALAVGVSFVALGVDVIPAAAIITVTTFLCTCVALLIGRRFGEMLGERATIIGGIVLIAIGLKAMFF